jgi:hypothetical protein
MRFLTVLSVGLLVSNVATAWGQYSLSSGPELIPLATPDPVAVNSPANSTAPQALPTGVTPTQFRYTPATLPAANTAWQPQAAPATPYSYAQQPAYANSYPYPQHAPAYQNPAPQQAPAYQNPYPQRPAYTNSYPYPRLADVAPGRGVAVPTVRPQGPAPTHGTPASNGGLPPIANGSAGPNGNPGPNGSWVMPPDASYDGGCGCGYSCGSCDPCCGGCPESPWFFSVVALMMARSDGDSHVLTVDRDHQEVPLLNSSMDMPWRAGGELRFGRSFCCNRWAVEGVYWTMAEFQGDQTAASSDPYGNVAAYCSNFNDAAGSSGSQLVTIGGISALQYFDAAAQPHRVDRTSQIQNVEINAMWRPVPPGCTPWDFTFAVGPRFFRFDDSLLFESHSTIDVGGTTQASYAYFRDQLTNTLCGGQAGFDSGLSLIPRLRLFFAPKIGLYNNHIEADYDLAGRVGSGQLQSAVSNTPGYPNYPLSGTKNTLATLTQADVGLDWNFAGNWTARIGYRLVAVTGVALADSQIPIYLNDTPALLDANRHDSLIIHGGFAGVGCRF